MIKILSYIKNHKFETVMNVILCGYVLFNILDFAKVITYCPVEEWGDSLAIPPVVGLIILFLFHIVYIVGLAKIESGKQKAKEQ